MLAWQPCYLSLTCSGFRPVALRPPLSESLPVSGLFCVLPTWETFASRLFSNPDQVGRWDHS